MLYESVFNLVAIDNHYFGCAETMNVEFYNVLS